MADLAAAHHVFLIGDGALTDATAAALESGGARVELVAPSYFRALVTEEPLDEEFRRRCVASALESSECFHAPFTGRR